MGRLGWGVALCVALILALLAVRVLYDSLFPIFIGFGLAYAFDPLADWLERKKLGRTTAVALILGVVFLGAFIIAAVVIPGLVRDAVEFARQFPNYLEALLHRAAALAEARGVSLPLEREQILARLRLALSGVSLETLEALSPVGVVAKRLFSGVAGFLVGMLNLLVIPLVFFYFLRDISQIRLALLRQVPQRWRKGAEARLDEADRVFSGYLRGQMSVAAILALIYSVGLSLVGIPFGVLIGLLAGLLNIVPYVGVATGLALSLTMALVDFAGWGQVVGVLGLFGCAQFLEGFFITPRIVGDKVGLNTVETIIALIIGGETGGLVGMVLAIPVAGCVKAWWNDFLAAYRRSPLYQG